MKQKLWKQIGKVQDLERELKNFVASRRQAQHLTARAVLRQRLLGGLDFETVDWKLLREIFHVKKQHRLG